MSEEFISYTRQGSLIVCNHVFIVRGFDLHCEKCGEDMKMQDFKDNTVKLQECESGRCGVI